MALRRLVIAAAVALACAGAARALDPARQMSQYVHDVWTTNEGLPQDSVNAVAQTPDGYLWVATQEGLARFDGISFTTFDASHGIIDNFVYTLYVGGHAPRPLGRRNPRAVRRPRRESLDRDARQRPAPPPQREVHRARTARGAERRERHRDLSGSRRANLDRHHAREAERSRERPL
jgi:hypothetical protein